jgi:hypothetical protein
MCVSLLGLIKYPVAGLIWICCLLTFIILYCFGCALPPWNVLSIGNAVLMASGMGFLLTSFIGFILYLVSDHIDNL